MRLFLRLYHVLCLSVGGLLVLSALVMAQESIQARLGIQIKSGDRIMRAKAYDRAQVGDLLRVYVVPEAAAFVYVMHTDGNTVSLLNPEQRGKIAKGDTVVLPGRDKFYLIKPGSTVERFTIICSPTEIANLTTLLASGEIAYSKWSVIEKDLLGKAPPDLTTLIDKPIPMAGNTRGVEQEDTFFAQLQNFSSKSLLVRQYELKVAQ
jgi:hypothetical protein